MVTTADANEESNAPYEVVFVHDTKATTCYGCKGRVRDKPSAPLPPAPYDLFIRHLERKIFKRLRETKKSGSVRTPKWSTITRYVRALASTMMTWRREGLSFREK